MVTYVRTEPHQTIVDTCKCITASVPVHLPVGDAGPDRRFGRLSPYRSPK